MVLIFFFLSTEIPLNAPFLYYIYRYDFHSGKVFARRKKIICLIQLPDQMKLLILYVENAFHATRVNDLFYYYAEIL